ncbi:MAG: hypothetical protein ACJ73N_14525, partial [Bryobacteraceae bacterium]
YLKSKHLYAFTRFNMLWVCPPLIISREELREGLDIIEQGLRLVDAELPVRAERLQELNYASR